MEHKEAEQASYLANRLRKRSKHLSRWLRKEGISCWRAYDVDIPEIPLAIDVYGDALSISLYERPYQKDPAAEDAWLALMSSTAAEALGIDPARVFTRMRKRQRGDGQYGKNETAETESIVMEGGLSFIINLGAYLDTGLFLDHRRLRATVRAEASGRRVLNLFCYTGSFSIYAASGGASFVRSIDLSNTYLDWGRRNAALNGLSDAKMDWLKADATEWMHRAREAGDRYGLIILDPPTFSNSTAMRRDMDINRDWPELVRQAAALLDEGGILYFSTNSRRLAFDPSLLPGLSARDISGESLDQDFRDRKMHRAWRIVREEPRPPPA